MLARALGILPVIANLLFLLSPFLPVDIGIKVIIAGSALTCASLLISILYIYRRYPKKVFYGHAVFVFLGFAMLTLDRFIDVNAMFSMLLLPLSLILLNSASVKMSHLLLDSSVPSLKAKAFIFNISAFFMLIAVALTPFLVGYPILQWIAGPKS